MRPRLEAPRPTCVRDEQSEDEAAIRIVHERAFGQPDEADLVDALRLGGYVKVSLVAEADGQVVGHILFTDLPIQTDAVVIPALALAPMGVLPEYQRQGLGSALIGSGLESCHDRGYQAVVVLGHPNYYPRFGFSAELARQIESPYAGEAFMATELVPGCLDGVKGRVTYAAPFQEL